MVFKIRMGQPEMEALWLDLSSRKLSGGLDKDEKKLFKKLVKACRDFEAEKRLV